MEEHTHEKLSPAQRLGRAAALTALIVGGFFPFIWMLLTSLKTEGELQKFPVQYLPSKLDFSNYARVFSEQPFAQFFFNSLAVSLLSTVLCIAAAVPAAYALARLNLRGRGLLLTAVVAFSMFPVVSLLIPLFRLMRTLGLLNTYWAMIVPGAAFLIPSSIFLLRTYMMRIPKELDEAAWVDGASRLYTLRRVILPLAMPGIVVVAIMTFIGAYAQQFIFALTFNSKTEFMPLPVGLFAFFGKQEVVWNELMAASFVGILPVMIVIIFLQRYLVAGLTAGAVKQ